MSTAELCRVLVGALCTSPTGFLGMRGREGTKAPPRPVRRVQEGRSDAPTSSLSCRRALASWVWTLPPGPPLTFLAFRLLPRPFVPHQQQLLQPGTDFDPVTFGSQGHIRKWLHLKPGGAEATPGQTSPSAPSSEAGEGRVTSGRRSSRERAPAGPGQRSGQLRGPSLPQAAHL